ncbi:hypothetical protein [Deinococcus roseus]|uniref:Uncharacterized protein n=1 Tax=Deinococcus roseus TaxID=392414 RepID=A0ABQ2DC30_9DEIO|nr:hypothetical protein [Deinococcus roseus]GGJ52889.1 hypothetical protein GCM10008938_43580 [Deinococcus roseus]
MTQPKPEPSIPVLPLEPRTETLRRPASQMPAVPPMMPGELPEVDPRIQRDIDFPLKS